jgi:hypothetical protein
VNYVDCHTSQFLNNWLDNICIVIKDFNQFQPPLTAFRFRALIINKGSTASYDHNILDYRFFEYPVLSCRIGKYLQGFVLVFKTHDLNPANNLSDKKATQTEPTPPELSSKDRI